MTAFVPTAAQFAEVVARWGLGPLTEAAPLAGGMVNPAWLLNGRAVLRLNQREPTSPKIAKEAWALGWAANRLDVVRVPAVLGADTSRLILPYDYLLLEYLPGVRGDTIWAGATPAARADLSRQLGATLARLHALPLPGSGYGGWNTATALLGTAESWVTVSAHHTEQMVAQAAELALLPPDQLAAVRGWFAEYRACVPDMPPRCLVHGDFGLWNALGTPAAGPAGPLLTAVFDFEWAQAAPAPLDFPPIFADPDDPLDPAAFLAGYSGGTRLPAAFVQQAHYYALAYHLDLLGVVHRHWAGAGGAPHQAAIAALLCHHPIPGWAAAGYSWPFA